MISELHVLYLLVVIAVVGCLFFAAREVRGRPMLGLSLLSPPLLAAFITFALALLGPLDALLEMILGVALIVGVIGGVIRGRTVSMQVDHQWDLVRLLRSRDTQSVAVLLAVAAAGEIVVSLAGITTPLYQALPLASAALSAGFLAGRTVVVSVRMRDAPHKELRWRLLRREDC